MAYGRYAISLTFRKGPHHGQPGVNQCVMRRIGVACVVATAALPAVAGAQPAGYPSKPIRVVVPFPAGVPVEIVRRVQAEVVKALAVPEVRRQLEESFLFPVGSSPEEFAEFIRKDIALQAGIMKQIGLEPE